MKNPYGKDFVVGCVEPGSAAEKAGVIVGCKVSFRVSFPCFFKECLLVTSQVVEINGMKVEGQLTDDIMEKLENSKLPVKMKFRLPKSASNVNPLNPKFRIVKENFENEEIIKESGRRYRRQLLGFYSHQRLSKPFYKTFVLKIILYESCTHCEILELFFVFATSGISPNL